MFISSNANRSPHGKVESMDGRGKHTSSEILQPATIWPEALAAVQAKADDLTRFWREVALRPGGLYRMWFHVLLGSPRAVLLQTQTGTPARAYPGSELTFSPHPVLTLMPIPCSFAVSRSGEITETIAAVNLFRKRYKGKVLVVTNYSESRLAQNADKMVAIDVAREVSVAQTRSFSSMAVVVEALAGCSWGQARLFDPAACSWLNACCATTSRLPSGWAKTLRLSGSSSWVRMPLMVWRVRQCSR